MSSSRQSHSSNNSGRSRHSARVIAQTTVDAKLHAEFEESSSSFDYSSSVRVSGDQQPSSLNPILVNCKTSGKPFYAIVHRVTGSLIIDFEPVKPYEVPMTAAGALQSYKLAAKAITRLQSLPSGSMERLCDTMVQEVLSSLVMTGFALSSHRYPQAARFLFMKNKVRMIVDCRAKHVKVYQDDKLPFDLTFCGSTLRAPHSCHLQYMENMNSIASLVMAVIINDGDDEGDNTDSHSRNKKERDCGVWLYATTYS
ncbi:hypothetical protein F3Y22_tig00111151pilonHSYRG00117 [Hibiscus syriacus]|uniref:Phytochrome chromophore attachment site domain-containing protein n=1 Tax=Hibiscus syriacus TaxID=106335 RepID=A0A6A2YXK2_HIBSY|nr:hypothetical protein F3Y22_tig00111151pilonHSYRG00117 [Hibiscus syriacus]